jgi:hypothetical protein
VVPVVGCAMVYVVEVRGKMRRIWSSILIEPHLAKKSGGKQIENRSLEAHSHTSSSRVDLLQLILKMVNLKNT